MLSTFPQSPHCFHHSTKVARKLRKQEREEGKEEGRKKSKEGIWIEKKKNVILLVNVIIYMENSTVSTKLSLE